MLRQKEDASVLALPITGLLIVVFTFLIAFGAWGDKGIYWPFLFGVIGCAALGFDIWLFKNAIRRLV